MAATTSRVAYSNLLTAAGVVVTSSTEQTGYVDDNLTNPARWKKWKSDATAIDQWVKFDLGSNQSFQVLAAVDAVLHTGGGTLRAQANATDAWGAPTVNDLLTPASPDYTGVIADWLSASSSLRWVRFYFTNTLGVAAAVTLGAVFVGPYLQPTSQLDPTVQITRVDPSVQRLALGGQRSSVTRRKYHDVQARYHLQSSAARDSLRTAFETVGQGVPCLFAVDPASNGLAFYGTLRGLPAQHHAGSLGLWDVVVQFTEDVG